MTSNRCAQNIVASAFLMGCGYFLWEQSLFNSVLMLWFAWGIYDDGRHCDGQADTKDKNWIEK